MNKLTTWVKIEKMERIFNLQNKQLLSISLLISSVLLLGGCGTSKEPISRTGFYFDTMVQITVYDEKEVGCLEDCLKLADHYEKMFSPAIEGSDIWKINHSAGQPVTVSDETIQLLETALAYCEMTQGRIDITIETVSELWDFHGDGTEISDNRPIGDILNTDRVPNENEITEAVSHVDYHNLLIDGNTVILADSKASISLGFIAKGYIADQIKEYLLSQNVQSAIINLGGNLLAVGSRPDGTPFQFGIQKPFDAQGTPIAVLSVSDKSAVSSGIYERYFYQDDILYHHILNPADGYPIQNNLLGVTILSDSSVDGDALSTSCFILGLDEGMKLIESRDDVEAIFITEDYCLHYSSGLEQ